MGIQTWESTHLDLHEKNLSRRFKAFGTGLSDDPRDSHGWARVDVAWSADALHWPASGSRRIVHESEIGQNDGTADVSDTFSICVLSVSR